MLPELELELILPHGTCLPEMLRNGSTFQQIFEVLVVDRFLELLEGPDARVNLCGGSLVHLVPHPCVREAEEQAHVLHEAVVVVGPPTRGGNPGKKA